MLSLRSFNLHNAMTSQLFFSVPSQLLTSQPLPTSSQRGLSVQNHGRAWPIATDLITSLILVLWGWPVWWKSQVLLWPQRDATDSTQIMLGYWQRQMVRNSDILVCPRTMCQKNDFRMEETSHYGLVQVYHVTHMTTSPVPSRGKSWANLWLASPKWCFLIGSGARGSGDGGSNALDILRGANLWNSAGYGWICFRNQLPKDICL